MTNVRDMLNNVAGDHCVEKHYYKCASTEEVSVESSLNNSINVINQNAMAGAAPTQRSSLDALPEASSNATSPDLRYNNKIGFKDGVLFPIAKKTNPPLAKKRTSQPNMD